MYMKNCRVCNSDISHRKANAKYCEKYNSIDWTKIDLYIKYIDYLVDEYKNKIINNAK